jgi:hypothetical protein
MPETPLPKTPLVELRDISIAFGGIRAVDRASVDLHAGEVVGLLGHIRRSRSPTMSTPPPTSILAAS